MRTAVEVIGWIIVASLVVLVVMNAGNAAQVISSASNAITTQSVVLTGSGYGSANYGKAA